MALSDTLRANITRFMLRDKIKSATELSRLSGVPQPTLHKFITGKHQTLSLEAVEKLANAFCTDPARLFERELLQLPNPKIQAMLHVMEKMDSYGLDIVLATGTAISQLSEKKV